MRCPTFIDEAGDSGPATVRLSDGLRLAADQLEGAGSIDDSARSGADTPEAEVAVVAALHDGLRTFQGHTSAVCDVVVERADK